MLDALVFECFSNYCKVFDLVMEQGMTQGLIVNKILFLGLEFSHSKPLIRNTQDFSK